MPQGKGSADPVQPHRQIRADDEDIGDEGERDEQTLGERLHDEHRAGQGHQGKTERREAPDAQHQRQ
jgi:hypothetical protein